MSILLNFLECNTTLYLLLFAQVDNVNILFSFEISILNLYRK